MTDGSSVTFNVELTQGAPQRSYTVEGFDGYLLGVGVTEREFGHWNTMQKQNHLLL